MSFLHIFWLASVGSLLLQCVHSMESVWNIDLSLQKDSQTLYSVFPNYLYRDSYIWVQITCDSLGQESRQVEVSWALQEVDCMEDMYHSSTKKQTSILVAIAKQLQSNKSTQFPVGGLKDAVAINFQASPPTLYDCGRYSTVLPLKDESALPYYTGHLPRSALNNASVDGVPVHMVQQKREDVKPADSNQKHRVVTAWGDGMYHFFLRITPVDGSIGGKAYIQMRGDYGYLPAISWPYMILNGVMGLVYLFLGTAWLFIWGCSSEHSTKIHLVIGGVIIAGATWNTLSFTDLTVTNNTGTRLLGVFWLCEIVSALQMAATYLMLMFVATGYRISRPQLSTSLIIAPMVICFVEFAINLGVLIINDEHLKIKYSFPSLVKVGYAFEGMLMIAILGWIMVFSIHTFLHLYRRRHSDHKMFQAFCIFMASCIVAFIVGGVTLLLLQGFFTSCRKNWQWEWMTQAAQQAVICMMLCVLAWLWRPLDAAQSYGFQPLGDSDKGRYDVDDEEEIVMEILTSEDGSTEQIKLMT